MKPLKHWRDPVSALIAVFLILSPWVLGYAKCSKTLREGYEE